MRPNPLPFAAHCPNELIVFKIKAKRCTLTITHPSGGQRTYTTPGVFVRKNEAKAQTAALAISMGALEFILTGNTDASITQGRPSGVLVLAPLDAPMEASVEAVAEDPLVCEIEQACVRWGAGRVTPYWVALVGNGQRESGCSILIPHPIPVPSTRATLSRLMSHRILNVFDFDRDGLRASDPNFPQSSSGAGVCFACRAGDTGSCQGGLCESCV